jgi:hypothetical protein
MRERMFLCFSRTVVLNRNMINLGIRGQDGDSAFVALLWASSLVSLSLSPTSVNGINIKIYLSVRVYGLVCVNVFAILLCI